MFNIKTYFYVYIHYIYEFIYINYQRYQRYMKYFRIASYTCSWITKIVEIHWELRGKEHLEQDRGCIIVSNHQSAFDILGMYQIWPIMKKCTAIARRELFYVWPFGLAAWLAGLIFIDRRNAEKARLLINDTAKYVKEKKVIVNLI